MALAFLVAYCSLSVAFLRLGAIERVVLVFPVEEPAGGEDGDEDGAERERLRQQRPVADIAEVEPAKVVEVHAVPFFAGGAGGFAPAQPGAGPTSGLTSGGGAARFNWNVSVNSLTRVSFSRAPGSGTDLISTSSGWVSHGDASMLRIKVETRAFDCA